MIDPHHSEVWLVGGGIASMAAAAFLVRDADVPGEHIHILEQRPVVGGSLDGAAAADQPGYFTRGGRMFEEQAYQTLWDLLATIPSLDDPAVSVREEMIAFNESLPSMSHARLVGTGGQILDASDYGFNARDRIEIARLMATPEHALGSRRIDEMFSRHFFTTHFWTMWRTMFAFQDWHSAVELRRYMLRLIQEFPRMHTLAGVRRTKYNQYDSIARPLQRWLVAQGIDIRFDSRVCDIDFDQLDPARRRATHLHLSTRGAPKILVLGERDVVLVTFGSIIADATFGGNDTIPELIRDRRGGDWALWDRIAPKATDFGRPETFYSVDENKWESFTLTMTGDALLRRIVALSGNEPGTGGLMTFADSGWLMSIVVPYQPHFPGLPADQFTLWGYGLFIDRNGNRVAKPMAGCSGREILTELVYHLGFEDALDEILATTDVTTVMMPYASAMFGCRAPGDRPAVVPEGAQNFAFLGQFVELPEDIVFTVEYSVHTAMYAIYRLFGVNREIPPIYHGIADPKVGLAALASIFGSVDEAA